MFSNFSLDHLKPTADFQRQATDYGIDVIAAESFTKDPSLQIANLKVCFHALVCAKVQPGSRGGGDGEGVVI